MPHVGRRLIDATRHILRGDALRQDLSFGEQHGSQGSREWDPYARMQILRGRTLTQEEVFTLYKQLGLAANVVDIPAEDMTRSGFKFSFPSEPRIAATIEQKLRQLNFKSVLHDMCRYELLTGDGFFLIGVAQDGSELNVEQNINAEITNFLASDLEEIVQANRLDDVTFLHPFHRFDVKDIVQQNDIAHRRYGQDQYIILSQDKNSVGSNIVHKIHSSRVAHLQMRGFTTEKFGTSIYQRLITDFQIMDTAQWSVGQILYSLFFKTLKSPRFKDMDDAKRQRVLDRMKSSIHALTFFVMDEDEEMQIVSPTGALAGFDAAATFLWDMMAGATRIPKHHLLGQRQGALTGAEWDSRVYYARILALQETYLREIIEYIIRLLLVAKNVGGLSVQDVDERDDSGKRPWSVEFNPLYHETEGEKAEREFKQSQTHAIYLQYGVVDADEVRGELDWVDRETEEPLKRVAPKPERPEIVSPGEEGELPAAGAPVPTAGVQGPSAFTAEQP